MRPLALALLLAVAGCAPAPTSGEPRGVRPAGAVAVGRGDAAGFLPPRALSLHWEGRVAWDEAGRPRFAWPASGFGLRFQGTGIVARLEDRLVEDAIRDADLLAVYVDDEAPRTVALAEGVAEVTLASDLPEGEHTVYVRKRTESEQGTVVVHALAVRGADARFLDAPPPRRWKLLAIGDSITAGYGIDGPDARCHYSAGTSNATRTYGYFAAQALDAEYQAIAWSGRGLYRNLEPSIPETMPLLYERRLATEDAPMDPREFVPDAVVVNLGTNDFALPDPDLGRIEAALRDLVARVRAHAPEAHVVVAVGPALADDYPPGSRALSKMQAIANAVVAAREAEGDRRVSFLRLYGSSPEEGYGCDFHPSLASHRRLAEALVAHLRPRLVP